MSIKSERETLYMNCDIFCIAAIAAVVLGLTVSMFLLGYVHGFQRSARQNPGAAKREQYQGKRVLPDGQEGVQEAMGQFYQPSEEDADAE